MRFITKEEDRYWRCCWNGNRISWKTKDNFSSEAEMQFVYKNNSDFKINGQTWF